MRSPLGAIRRILSLRPREKLLVSIAFLEHSRIDLELRMIGFRKLLSQIERETPVAESAVRDEDIERARQYARWVGIAARVHPLNPQCLHRSLVLHRWLRRESLPSRLRIGVRKEGSSLLAHAWIELAGVIVNDEPVILSRFQVLVGGRPDLPHTCWTA